MDNIITIKIKVDNIEIEVSGDDKSFVSEKVDMLIEKLLNHHKKVESPKVDPVHHPDTIGEKVSVLADRISDEGSHLSAFDRLAISAKITSNQLKNLITEKSDGTFYINFKEKGKTVDLTKKVSKIILVASESLCSIEEMTGKSIGRHMKYLKIDTHHLSEYLNDDKNISYHDGRYKLTPAGRDEAYAIIKELSNPGIAGETPNSIEA